MSCRRAMILALTLCPPAEALAAEPSPKKPSDSITINSWNGAYIGGAVGYSIARTSWVQDGTIRGSAMLKADDAQLGPVIGSIEAGYNHVFPSGMVLGVNADFSIPDRHLIDPALVDGASGPLQRQNYMQFYGGVRAKAGYAFNNWLLYAQGGFAYNYDRVQDSYPSGAMDDIYFWRPGWTVGAGIETKLDAHWSAKLEYNFYEFASTQIFLPMAAQTYSSNFKVQQARLGLNYHFDADEPHNNMPVPGILPDMSRLSLHGQMTMVSQGSMPFRALYSGPASLYPGGELRENWSTTANIGIKIVEGTEVYFNPESYQGYGLSRARGIASFPNTEAQNAGFPFPQYNTSRLFIRQTFGFGGAQEDKEDGENQVAGKADISRLTLTFGKFAVNDIFDGNTYAHDPRTSFMNLTLTDSGAFDAAADVQGYTWGFAADFNQKDWAIRAGYFLVPAQPNGNDFDTRIGYRGQYIAELESRYQLFSQTGKLRLTGWLNRVFTGSFSETLADPYLNPLTAPPDSPGILATRKTRTEFGFNANLEHALTDDIGVFALLSWRNGKTEITSWTDIDYGLSAGTVIQGTSWQRPDDKIGLGFAINGLSKNYRTFLAAGGLGLQIGDGRLTYQTEKILEAYYSYNISKLADLTFDYQIIADPAYNADRGPVSVGALKLRVHF